MADLEFNRLTKTRLDSLSDIHEGSFYLTKLSEKEPVALHYAVSNSDVIELGSLIQGQGDNSIVQSNVNAQALSTLSVAVGESSIAGCKGYRYISAKYDDSTSKYTFKTNNPVSFTTDLKLSLLTAAQSFYNYFKIESISEDKKTLVCTKDANASSVSMDFEYLDYEKISNDSSLKDNITPNNYVLFCLDNKNPDNADIELIKDLSIGSGSFSCGNGSVSIGSSCKSIGRATVSMGRNCISTNNGSVALGNGCVAYGNSGVALGYKSTVHGKCSIAAGFQCTANSAGSAAFGHNCVTKRDTAEKTQIVVGQYNAESLDSIFVVGVGESNNSRANALEVKYNGSTKFNNEVTFDGFAYFNNLLTASSANITGAATVGANLTTKGWGNFNQGITVKSGAEVGGVLKVAGETTINNKFTVNSSAWANFKTGVTIHSTAEVKGSFITEKDATVGGKLTANSSASVANSLTVGEKLTANQSAEVKLDLNVGGDLIVADTVKASKFLFDSSSFGSMEDFNEAVVEEGELFFVYED